MSQFRIRRSLFSRALADSDDPFSVFEVMVVITFWQSHVRTGSVESGASICTRVFCLCASVRLSLIDTLDTSHGELEPNLFNLTFLDRVYIFRISFVSKSTLEEAGP